MNATRIKPDLGLVRAAQPSAELRARNPRPDLFAAADDLIEAELIRAGWIRTTAA